METETHSVPQLLALLEEATPAPWQTRGSPDNRGITNEYEDEQGRRCRDLVSSSVQFGRDAALIVALRNEAPALLAELVELRASLSAAQLKLAEAERREAEWKASFSAHVHDECGSILARLSAAEGLLREVAPYVGRPIVPSELADRLARALASSPGGKGEG